MINLEKTGAAPVSKYAAKKRVTRVEDAKAEAKASANIENEAKEANAENEAKAAPQKQATGWNYASKHAAKKEGLPASSANYPDHVVAIALLIKNNAEIRRFTALGILNYLLQKGEIKGESRYVSFKWNKFMVKCGGLTREYFYTEPFFINALIASFSSFSASAQRSIEAFCRKEMSVGMGKAADADEVDNIVKLNEAYQAEAKPKRDNN